MIQNILLLSRLAFICNLVFLVALFQLATGWVQEAGAVSNIGVLGLVLAFVFNPLVNLIYLFLRWKRKELFLQVPAWLVWANFIFLLLQITYFIYRNVTSYYS